MMSDTVRILIVDDEKRILETYSLMLMDIGYSVQTASQPDEAIRLVQGEKFDIAFIDQFLGPARGLELMQELSRADPALYFVLMTANGSTDLAVDALKRGASDFISKPFFIADLIKSIEHVNMKRSLDKQKQEMLAMLERTVEQMSGELNRVHFSVLSSLAQAMEKRDVGTFGHSKRVTYNARLIAAALDLGEREQHDLKTAAMLHDIGKIGITDFILGKQGPLDQAEKDIVKSHPQKGCEILQPLKQFESILPAILHHHEHYDGSGYPGGLAGDTIPLYARIISVADTYDAILSTRPYRTGAAHEQAIAELTKYAGTQFDPVIVKAFVEADVRYREAVAPAEWPARTSAPPEPRLDM
jgi:putative nucleotidyltransferase with HDIG domain